MDPDVDEHSVMTYLSQFPKAKLKPGAPVKAKQLFPDKAKAYGPGGFAESETMNIEGVHVLLCDVFLLGQLLILNSVHLLCPQMLITSPHSYLCLLICVSGIEPHGNMVLQPAVFTVETLEAGSGEVLVYVEDPEGHKEEVSYNRRIIRLR